MLRRGKLYRAGHDESRAVVKKKQGSQAVCGEAALLLGKELELFEKLMKAQEQQAQGDAQFNLWEQKCC